MTGGRPAIWIRTHNFRVFPSPHGRLTRNGTDVRHVQPLLEDLVSRYGSAEAVARLLGCSRSWISLLRQGRPKRMRWSERMEIERIWRELPVAGPVIQRSTRRGAQRAAYEERVPLAEIQPLVARLVAAHGGFDEATSRVAAQTDLSREAVSTFLWRVQTGRTGSVTAEWESRLYRALA